MDRCSENAEKDILPSVGVYLGAISVTRSGRQKCTTKRENRHCKNREIIDCKWEKWEFYQKMYFIEFEILVERSVDFIKRNHCCLPIIEK